MNPLFIVGVAAVGVFAYEANQAAKVMAAAREPTAHHIPLASSRFTNMKENPFQQKEKLQITAIQPTQAGQLNNPHMAGRWMLTLPGGAMMPITGSFNILKRKLVIVNFIPKDKKEPKGLKEIGPGEYQMTDISAVSLFEQ